MRGLRFRNVDMSTEKELLVFWFPEPAVWRRRRNMKPTKSSSMDWRGSTVRMLSRTRPFWLATNTNRDPCHWLVFNPQDKPVALVRVLSPNCDWPSAHTWQEDQIWNETLLGFFQRNSFKCWRKWSGKLPWEFRILLEVSKERRWLWSWRNWSRNIWVSSDCYIQLVVAHVECSWPFHCCGFLDQCSSSQSKRHNEKQEQNEDNKIATFRKEPDFLFVSSTLALSCRSNDRRQHDGICEFGAGQGDRWRQNWRIVNAESKVATVSFWCHSGLADSTQILVKKKRFLSAVQTHLMTSGPPREIGSWDLSDDRLAPQPTRTCLCIASFWTNTELGWVLQIRQVSRTGLLTSSALDNSKVKIAQTQTNRLDRFSHRRLPQIGR